MVLVVPAVVRTMRTLATLAATILGAVAMTVVGEGQGPETGGEAGALKRGEGAGTATSGGGSSCVRFITAATLQFLLLLKLTLQSHQGFQYSWH